MFLLQLCKSCASTSSRLPNTRYHSIKMQAFSFKVLTAVSWGFTGLAILLTAGRFWIRSKIIKKLSWDDAAHLMGLLLLVAQVSIMYVAASLIYPFAKSEAGDDGHSNAEHLLFVRLNITVVLVTWCCLYAVKLSFLLLYHRIFQISKNLIRAWWIVLAVVFLTFSILVVGFLTECDGLSALEHVGMSSLSMYHSKLPMA